MSFYGFNSKNLILCAKFNLHTENILRSLIYEQLQMLMAEFLLSSHQFLAGNVGSDSVLACRDPLWSDPPYPAFSALSQWQHQHFGSPRTRLSSATPLSLSHCHFVTLCGDWHLLRGPGIFLFLTTLLNGVRKSLLSLNPKENSLTSINWVPWMKHNLYSQWVYNLIEDTYIKHNFKKI